MYPLKVTFSPQKPVSTIRLCKDCTFYRPVLLKQTGVCTICGDINIINGRRDLMLADDARRDLCGEEGNFFIPGNSAPIPLLLYEKDIDFIKVCTMKLCALLLAIRILTLPLDN